MGRYYDPATGQFLSVDPLVDETGQAYAYASDDPVNASDPTGTCVSTPFGCIGPGPADGISGTLGAAWNGVKSFATGFVGNAPGCDNNGAAYDTGNVAWWVISIGGVLGSAAGSGGANDDDSGNIGTQGAAATIGSAQEFNPESLEGLTPDEVKAQIPPDWVQTPSKSGGGEVFSDPSNPGRQIRIMPGYGAGVRPDPITAGPYAVVSQNGAVTKVPLAGNPTLR